MTKLLEKAFEEVSKLPEAQQDVWAKTWLAELQDEQIWDEKFADSLTVLDKLAEEAHAEFRAGKTIPLDDIF